MFHIFACLFSYGELQRKGFKHLKEPDFNTMTRDLMIYYYLLDHAPKYTIFYYNLKII